MPTPVRVDNTPNALSVGQYSEPTQAEPNLIPKENGDPNGNVNTFHDSRAIEILADSNQRLQKIATLLEDLLERKNQPSRATKGLNQLNNNRDERELGGQDVKNGFSPFAVFLALVAAALLGFGQATDTTQELNAAYATTVCWIVGLMVALLASVASVPLHYDSFDELLQPAALQTLFSMGMIVIGTSIWVWNVYPTVVAATSTVIGVFLWLSGIIIPALWRFSRRSSRVIPGRPLDGSPLGSSPQHGQASNMLTVTGNPPPQRQSLHSFNSNSKDAPA